MNEQSTVYKEKAKYSSGSTSCIKAFKATSLTPEFLTSDSVRNGNNQKLLTQTWSDSKVQTVYLDFKSGFKSLI